MSPVTKKLLMQKLIEVKEQIGDSGSESQDDIDGFVAGSIIPTFKKEKKDNGLIIQRALDRNKTKLIISQIDEEDETLQFDEDEEM